MPELPELEVLKERLRKEIIGHGITEVAAPQPIVLRCLIDDLCQAVQGKKILGIERHGKFLRFLLPDNREIVMNLMLAGRLQVCPSQEKATKRTCLILTLDDSRDFRFRDQRNMGRIYLATGHDYAHIPKYLETAIEATDPALTWDVFRERIRKHTGQMKGVLSTQAFVGGIGSAYSDEILFMAGVHPFRKRPSLSEEELRAVYDAMRSVLPWAIDAIRAQNSPLHEQDRSFMRIHMKTGQPCPKCGAAIVAVNVNQEFNNFCPHCQPRGRLGAMH
jgi:formamidopyrimidine-DNA glycosylase